MKMPDVPALRAAAWTIRATRSARRTSRRGIRAARVPAPPALPAEAARGVTGVLRRRNDTCLVRALVLQAWHASQGSEREVIIGVTAPSQGFRAHAWLDGDPACHDEPFEELTRLPVAR